MPNKLIGQRFKVDDRVKRKMTAVRSNKYTLKEGSVTEALTKKINLVLNNTITKFYGMIKGHLNTLNMVLNLSSKVFLVLYFFFGCFKFFV